jgi:hypothetical protein
MNAGYTTIITPILPTQTEALRLYLRSNVEPIFDKAEILRCKASFPFDQLQGLHFCSFLILEGDAEFDPCLVFEATFDGPRDDFLHALLLVALKPVDEIYRHCEGYPVSGTDVPELIKAYLADHDVGAHTFFRGSPGRTVAQIKGEAQLHDQLVEYVCDRWQKKGALPAEFAGLQRELQQHVVREQPVNRWAEQAAAVPWEVAGRIVTAGVVVLAGIIAACGLGAIFLGLFGQGPSHVSELWPGYISKLGDLLYGASRLNEVNPGKTSLPLVALVTVWIVLRFIQLLLGFKDPRQESFPLRSLVLLLIICRYAATALFVGYSVLLLDQHISPFPSFTSWLMMSTGPSALQAVLALIGAGFVLLLLQHRATSLKLKVQFQELEPREESFRRLEIDCLRFAMVLTSVFVLFVIASCLPSSVSSALGASLLPYIRVLLVLVVYLFAGLIVAYAIVLCLFLAVRMIELRDKRRFVDAEGLTARPVDISGVYAREEGGTNTYQNHLASLTHVKPGLLRVWFLRLTLLVIELLSRFWFNVGDLGGIPTILSARWVMIDGGRRLLFLDNYGGAWDSYLNEFIDMQAVWGLNAIWTNTFVKAADAEYAFPETSYYLWKGAQVERPFKAYVRQSQIETIVWYSAYPKPATVNINTSTNLRQSLFKPLDWCKIDSLFQNL